MSQWQPSASTSTCAPRSQTRSKNHIRRPRNSFIIFRSEFLAQQQRDGNVDLNRGHVTVHISRIVAEYWNNMSEKEKQPWCDMAEQEKRDHRDKYPDYKYRPSRRTKPVIKRKGKDGCEPEIIMKMRRDASIATSNVPQPSGAPSAVAPPQALGWQHTINDNVVPAFRSPLIPPAQFPNSNHWLETPDTNFCIDQPYVCLAPPTSYQNQSEAVNSQLTSGIQNLPDFEFYQLQDGLRSEAFIARDLSFCPSYFDLKLPFDAYASSPAHQFM